MNPLDIASIRQDLQQRQPAYLDLLRQMVEVNSFTANPAGVNRLGDLTAEAFGELGFQATRVQAADPSLGKHLVLARPGEGPVQIGLVSHLDTVFPPEEEARNDFRWRPVGHRIYGPGTVDIKGGTAMIYAVLDQLLRHVPALADRVTWKVLLNAAEERLVPDFGELCLAELDPERTRACLVFEGGALEDRVHSLVVARKGMAIFRVEAFGKAAHAGSAHPWGANAVVQLADAIRHIAALTDYGRDLTFNVGVVQGGTVVNRVPHRAWAQVEMRTFEPAIFQEGMAAMGALDGMSTVRSAKGAFPAQVAVTVERETGPWSPNERTEGLYRVWEGAAQEVGMAVVREHRGGLSDGNLVWHSLPTLDGLGPAGGNAHCSEWSQDGSKEPEFLDVRSFAPKALLNVVALIRLIQGPGDVQAGTG